VAIELLEVVFVDGVEEEQHLEHVEPVQDDVRVGVVAIPDSVEKRQTLSADEGVAHVESSPRYVLLVK